MNAAEKDFSTFDLGDDVYKLADNLMPEIAGRLSVEISDAPNTKDFQAMLQKVGTIKIPKEDEEIEGPLDRDSMIDLVERSGVQRKLHRSVWTPEITIKDNKMDAALIMGGFANWQDRGSDIVINSLFLNVPVYSIAGNRTMEGATEIVHPDVMNFLDKFGRYPTEAEYAGSVIIPRLVEEHFTVLPKQMKTTSSYRMLRDLFSQEPGLLESRIVVAKFANSAVSAALRVREVALKLNPEFDSQPSDPQLFVATDDFPLARTREQEKQPVGYQIASTALRQIVLTAKKLHETAQFELSRTSI